MFDQTFHSGDDYFDIEAAIRNGHFDYARERLRDVLQETPDAEAWYLAALVAPTTSQRITLLEKALTINPTHDRARYALDQAHLSDSLHTAPTSFLARLQSFFRHMA